MSHQARLGARTPMDVGSFYSLMGGNGKPNRRQSWPLKSLGQYARPLLEKLVGVVVAPSRPPTAELAGYRSQWPLRVKMRNTRKEQIIPLRPYQRASSGTNACRKSVPQPDSCSAANSTLTRSLVDIRSLIATPVISEGAVC